MTRAVVFAFDEFLIVLALISTYFCIRPEGNIAKVVPGSLGRSIMVTGSFKVRFERSLCTNATIGPSTV